MIPPGKDHYDDIKIMLVEDGFDIYGKGSIIVGRLERRVRIGQRIEILAPGGNNVSTVIMAIEQFNKTLDEGLPGQSVGLLLANVNNAGIMRGWGVVAR